MSPSILGLAGLGLLLGCRHAFEPDHLAAVATLARRQGRLLVAAAPTGAAQLTYFGAFACGTMIGMLAVSFSLAGLVRVASGQGAKWATALHLGSAVASVVVGVVLAGRVVGGLGLG